MIWKMIAGIAGGLVVATLAGNILNLVSGQKGTSAGIALLLWVAIIVRAVKAPRAARVWRWLLVLSAVLSFTVPLAATLAGVASGLVGFVGTAMVFFPIGLAFLVIGLLVGRDMKSEAVSGEKQ